MQIIQNRRRFLAGLSAARRRGLLGAGRALAAEPPPETPTARFARFPWGSLHRAAVRRRGAAAWRGFHRLPLRASRGDERRPRQR